MAAVKKRFPENIRIEEFLYIETNYLHCTLAEVRASPASKADKEVELQSRKNLEGLTPTVPFQNSKFPDGGFAYFPNRSIADVAGEFDNAGDEALGYNVGEEIFSGKLCFGKLIERGERKRQLRYMDIITDSTGIVVAGKDRRHIVIVCLPTQNRAYYFGP